MKKTFNINVAGFPFTIDDDAYSLLRDYLDTIEHAFGRVDDARELISDIESRIAELLLERTSEGSPIVTAEDVEQVIKRVGQPEEMVEEDSGISFSPETGEATESESIRETLMPPPYVPPLPPVKKKLYRDPQNAMLGGVCSGLAHYFNVDPTPVRLLTVLLVIISMATVSVAYLLLWLIVPEARTPLQRMQMLGEQPTMENIGRTVTDNFREDNQSQAINEPVASANFGSSLARFFGLLAKVAIIIGLIIGIPLLIAMVIGLIGCIYALIMFGTSWGGTWFGSNIPQWYEAAGSIPVYGVLIGIGGILVLGIPLFILIRMGLKKNANPLAQGVRNTLIVLWGIGFVLAAICTGRILNLHYDRMHHNDYYEYNSNDFDGNWDESDKEEIVNDNIDNAETSIIVANDSVSVTVSSSDTLSNKVNTKTTVADSIPAKKN